ncbi:MAG: DUF5060 domain-containing protein [Planctomycetota bacterium]|jgi:hypothetical protein
MNEIQYVRCFAAGLILSAVCTAATPPVAKWAPMEITFTGPESRGRGEPNPFGILLDVVFTSPGGRQYRVPGFYDGDGHGGLDGDVWKVRFSADQIGDWTYTSQSKDGRLNGRSGTFAVTEPPEDAPQFYRWGRLEYTGTAENKLRYLKFRDGPYWLKAGCDDPENFLGAYSHYNTTAKRKAAPGLAARPGKRWATAEPMRGSTWQSWASGESCSSICRSKGLYLT